MERLGDPARDSGLRVCVTAERDGEADGGLDAVTLEERRDRLRHGALAGDVELVAGANVIERPREVVAQTLLDLVPDRRLRMTRPREKRRQGGGLRAADPLRMIVGRG